MESFGFKGLLGGYGGKGKNPYLAIRADPVDVEEYESDAAGALSGRQIHRTILRIRRKVRPLSAAGADIYYLDLSGYNFRFLNASCYRLQLAQSW
jgi:hypothetical protein